LTSGFIVAYFRGMQRGRPIGIFDSGIGGLTVFKAIKERLPNQRIVYLGDTARLPYGNKSPATIIRYSKENATFLKEKGVGLVVVACNTSSAYAIEELGSFLDIPVVGVIEPGVRAAISATRNGKIGVIGTRATVASDVYAKRIRGFAASLYVTSVPCPLFVPLVEEGWIEGEVPLSIARSYLGKIKDEGVDTLILGCTHYPLLKKVISEVMGDGVTLVDSGEALADSLTSLLSQGKALDRSFECSEVDGDIIYLTDYSEAFEATARRFLGSVALPPIKQI